MEQPTGLSMNVNGLKVKFYTVNFTSRKVRYSELYGSPTLREEKFRQVFDTTGYLRHFNHMMRIDETEEATEAA
ncbi:MULTISPECIES: hypothetical protein [unclassified Lysobacter]|uniref:hypothetical protein n=1 Tax=unclassified Lysobacter TaxID=2635362 RepID=UPI000A7798EF|nr:MULTISPECIES: hypothetical protein [unclassified Lysobacter]